MNNQVKLIDQLKAKLIEKVNSLDKRTDRRNDKRLHYEAYVYEQVIKMIEELGPPVPTIKPGDKVKYTGWQFKDEVDTAIVDHLRVQALATYAVIESGKKYYIVPLNHLEVVE